jgi:hypothetical protein
MYELRDYASPKAKLTQMLRKGELLQICRGVYCTSKDDPKFPIASMIYSPSYISFETALAYYQMIPERTFAVMSAGFRLKKQATPLASKDLACYISTGETIWFSIRWIWGLHPYCSRWYRNQTHGFAHIPF